MRKRYNGAAPLIDVTFNGGNRFRPAKGSVEQMLLTKLQNGGKPENRHERKLFEKMMKQNEKKLKGRNNDNT